MDGYIIKNLETQMEQLDIQEEDYYVNHQDDPNNEWCEEHRKRFKRHLTKLLNQ